MKSAAQEVYEALKAGKPVNVRDLPAGAAKEKGLEMERQFTTVVDILRNFPNPHICELGKLLWNLVEHSITPVAVGPDVPTISFAALGAARGDKIEEPRRGLIILPLNWLDELKNHPTYITGGVIYVGSQCRDLYNGRIVQDGMDLVVDRAAAYEAEYVLTMQKMAGPSPIPRHQGLVKKYPEGIKSCGVMYEAKPWVAPN